MKNLHHDRPIDELFAKIKSKMITAYHTEIGRLCFFGEPTEQQKSQAFAYAESVGSELLKRIDYKHHPHLKYAKEKAS